MHICQKDVIRSAKPGNEGASCLAKQKQRLGPPTTCAHIEHFLETCLLLLIQEMPDHGYSLLDRLTDFGFISEELNVGTLYRTLRRLDQEDLVTSAWAEGQGPRRRVYTITGAGRQALATWIGIIRSNKARIERLLTRYSRDDAAETGGTDMP